jgi:hypothetical protein
VVLQALTHQTTLYQAVVVEAVLALEPPLKLVTDRHLLKTATLCEVPQVLVATSVKLAVMVALLLGTKSRRVNARY